MIISMLVRMKMLFDGKNLVDKKNPQKIWRRNWRNIWNSSTERWNYFAIRSVSVWLERERKALNTRPVMSSSSSIPTVNVAQTGCRLFCLALPMTGMNLTIVQLLSDIANKYKLIVLEIFKVD